MPTYEYVCRSCGHLFEIVQSMRDEALTECPECGGELRKVFAPPAISFKGSGFYATDHGKKAASATGEKGEKGEKTDKGEPKKETSSDGTKDSKKEATSKASTSPKASPSTSGTSPSGTEGGGS
jgi:putative FmdB family regulatory protein